MDVLTILRTQPVQGQPVTAGLLWNDEAIGTLDMPFAAWIKVKRLLEKGLEMDARENYALKLKLSIKGAEGVALQPETAQPVDHLAGLEPHADDAWNAEEASLYPKTMDLTELPEAGEVKPGAIRSLR